MPSNRERAVELRKQGLSRSQICDALGLVSGGSALTAWIKDIPKPDWTNRPNAKDDLREQARALRREGKSYREILEVVPVSKGTLSLWLADIVLTDEQRDRLAFLQQIGRSKAGRTIQARRLTRQRATMDAAAAQIPVVAESELFVAGVVAYWAEGSKAKPWRPGERVTFINSDKSMILLFLRWLELLGISSERLIFRVSIHETADESAAVRYWAAVVGVDSGQFSKSSIKRDKPRTNRKNTGDDYHGCLVINVRRSTELYRQIAGWWAGIVGSLYPEGEQWGVV